MTAVFCYKLKDYIELSDLNLDRFVAICACFSGRLGRQLTPVFVCNQTSKIINQTSLSALVAVKPGAVACLYSELNIERTVVTYTVSRVSVGCAGKNIRLGK